MIILGIDPGTRKMGYGIIKSPKFEYIECGTIYSKKKKLQDRLFEMGKDFQQILKKFEIKEASIEDVFSGSRNRRSSLVLAHMRGILIYFLTEQNIPVFSYPPKKVKKQVTGTGKASKKQVGHTVKLIAKLKEVPQEDASDALAVAICHHLNRKNLR